MSKAALTRRALGACAAFFALLAGASAQGIPEIRRHFDVIIHGGQIYDGTGAAPYIGDVGINDDRITGIGDLSRASAATLIDARGQAISPGFINELSGAELSLIGDGSAVSDVIQGVTLEVVGEGASMGPVNANTRALFADAYPMGTEMPWQSFGGYLEYLEHKGIALNVASFLGAATPRMYVMGFDDRPPTPAELTRMQDLTRQAMREGALGVSSALIYPPASYAKTDELVALAAVAHESGGIYISHLRSEGRRLLPALDELIDISRRSGAPAEIYHLKVAGHSEWSKMDRVLDKIEAARASGLKIFADMYPYTAGSTGLRAILPPWVADGGADKQTARLRDPKTRARIVRQIESPTIKWENLFELSGPEGIVLLEANASAFKPLIGKNLVQIGAALHRRPADAAVQVMLGDPGGLESAFFMISEHNIRREILKPWISFCSDGPTFVIDPNTPMNESAHPRDYGAFARVLGKYVRDEGLISLADAIRRMTAQSAERLSIRERGLLRIGYFADVVVFDPATIRDRATFSSPHRYATGVSAVLVNGHLVIRDGKSTGELPGRAVRGPGWNTARITQ